MADPVIQRRLLGGGVMQTALLAALGAIVLAAAGVVAAVFGAAPSEDGVDAGFFGILFAGLFCYWVVGAIIVLRANGHAVGWLFAVSAAMTGTVFACYALGFLLSLRVPPDPMSGWLNLAGAILFTPAIILLLPSVAIVYPDGALPGPRWRWPVRIVVVLIVIRSVAIVLRPGPMGGDGGPANPLTPRLDGLSPDAVAFLSMLETVGSVSILLALATGVAAVIHRVRHAQGVERQQMKWFLAAVVPAAILLPMSLDETVSAIPLVDILSVATLPFAAATVALAILRYRLYAIDRIISRTIGWALVTGLLLAVFAVGVIALSTVLAGFTEGQTLAVAASTLAAFALFQPVRGRVQRAVDRRFDRARYDGERTAAAFAERLRDDIDLASLTTELDAVVNRTVAPRMRAIWLRHP
jgi:hypothetical protein